MHATFVTYHLKVIHTYHLKVIQCVSDETHREKQVEYRTIILREGTWSKLNKLRKLNSVGFGR